mmetsp:Transcript_22543/g.72997  ORF Transcript_22543/g.72997 Transcript_22543/m.72997 type:complete len:284 (-) Transcript_22543:468-1319(-)
MPAHKLHKAGPSELQVKPEPEQGQRHDDRRDESVGAQVCLPIPVAVVHPSAFFVRGLVLLVLENLVEHEGQTNATNSRELICQIGPLLDQRIVCPERIIDAPGTISVIHLHGRVDLGAGGLCDLLGPLPEVLRGQLVAPTARIASIPPLQPHRPVVQSLGIVGSSGGNWQQLRELLLPKLEKSVLPVLVNQLELATVVLLFQPMQRLVQITNKSRKPSQVVRRCLVRCRNVADGIKLLRGVDWQLGLGEVPKQRVVREVLEEVGHRAVERPFFSEVPIALDVS